MRTISKRFALILALTGVMVLAMAGMASAASPEVTGYCYFNGTEIINDFDSNTIAQTISKLEPGDEVTFKVKFENKYDEDTQWYMRNEALKTLEDSYDRTQNGGYTYTLTHITPGGTREVLFDNSKVGGDDGNGNSYSIPTDGTASHGFSNSGEGLHQATNALDEWFFIQTLKKGQSAYTELYVKFDGETEVNDYMDTAGQLMVAYAVELGKKGAPGTKYDENGRIIKEGKESHSGKSSGGRTGDDSHLLTYIATFTAGILMLILAMLSYRKDRRNSVAMSEAGHRRESGFAGKERD